MVFKQMMGFKRDDTTFELSCLQQDSCGQEARKADSQHHCGRDTWAAKEPLLSLEQVREWCKFRVLKK